eukprot:SAG31_NODE_7747_length_1605_cov_1.277556_1_plen_43_part_10
MPCVVNIGEAFVNPIAGKSEQTPSKHKKAKKDKDALRFWHRSM